MEDHSELKQAKRTKKRQTRRNDDDEGMDAAVQLANA
jgi:hypothetical protein